MLNSNLKNIQNMKKIIVILALTVMAGSCKKNPLDITPDGRLTINGVFNNEIQTGAFLNSAYAYIPGYLATYHYYGFMSPLSDESQDSDVGNEVDGGVAGLWIVGALSPNTNPIARASAETVNNDHYSSFWTGIRYANVFLQNIDNANVSDLVSKSRFKAEAQMLRAFYYWELIKELGSFPVVDKPFDPGFDYKSLTRPSFQADIDFIVRDCDSAIANPDLPIRITQAVDRGRFSKAVAYAIKSQALLYNASPLWNPSNDPAKWVAAAKASKDALTALTGNGYALAANYESYFLSQADLVTSPSDKETIYERPGGLPATARANNSITAKTGSLRAGTCPSQELVDSYDMQATGQPAITGYMDNDHLIPIINVASGYKETDPYTGRDPRFYATVWYNNALYDNIAGAGKLYPLQIYTGGADQLIKTPPNKRNTHTGYYLRKFIDSKQANTLAQTAGWKKYRLAEIYLNYAEAENEASGPIPEVYAAINTIRSRAVMPNLPTGLSKDEMRERIHRERRVELAIEEHRFWDVRRWKILDQTDKLVTGMEIIKNTNGTFTYNRFVTERRNAWQDKFRIFPIPIGDASKIPDFGLNQNPGW